MQLKRALFGRTTSLVADQLCPNEKRQHSKPGTTAGMGTEDEVIIDEICAYAEEKQIKEILQEYLKRIILEKPDNPLRFLINTIKKNPVEPTK